MIFNEAKVIEIIKYASCRGYEVRIFKDNIEINVNKSCFICIYFYGYADIVIVYKQISISERVISSDELKDLLNLSLSA